LGESAHIDGLQGEFLTGYERAAFDKVFEELRKPNLPGKREKTGT